LHLRCRCAYSGHLLLGAPTSSRTCQPHANPMLTPGQPHANPMSTPCDPIRRGFPPGPLGVGSAAAGPQALGCWALAGPSQATSSCQLLPGSVFLCARCTRGGVWWASGYQLLSHVTWHILGGCANNKLTPWYELIGRLTPLSNNVIPLTSAPTLGVQRHYGACLTNVRTKKK
jgi:hypothetical protein